MAKTSKEKRLDDNYQIAYDFATKTYKKFQQVIKSIVLFGSTAKHEVTKKSDIDIIIIIDDCTVDWDQELIAWYRAELARLIEQQKYKKEIHVSTVTLSSFWNEVKIGEPMVINVLRYGEVLIDFGGFFEPLKVLLARGKIRPTPEATYVVMTRAYEHLWRSKNSILVAVESNYWATVDAAHAALMANHLVPPSPEHIAEMLYMQFVKRRLLDKKYVEFYEHLRKLAKDVTHGVKTSLDHKEFKDIMDNSKEFVDVLTKLAKSLIKDEKIIRPVRKVI